MVWLSSPTLYLPTYYIILTFQYANMYICSINFLCYYPKYILERIMGVHMEGRERGLIPPQLAVFLHAFFFCAPKSPLHMLFRNYQQLYPHWKFLWTPLERIMCLLFKQCDQPESKSVRILGLMILLLQVIDVTQYVVIPTIYIYV